MVTIEIVTLSTKDSVVSRQSFAVSEGTILNALIQTNTTFNAPCGGNHICNKCMLEISYNGKKEIVQSCTTLVKEGMIVYIKKEQGIAEKIIKKPLDSEYFMCLDLGTTTLVFYVVDAHSGETVFTESLENPQTIFGGDVISRIQYANTNGTGNLFNAITQFVENEIKKLKDYRLSELYVCGNPTMLHLFCNQNVKTLGEFPYCANFLEKKELKGSDIKLSIDKVVLLPSFSPFVGADLSAGVLQTNLLKGNNILIDLGTNGEMVLSYEGKIYATSTAAGPAFEGVGIECGSGGLEGAINHVEVVNNCISFTTVNNEEPKSITGSGLIDIISILKNQNTILSLGKLLSKDNKYYLTDKVYITQKDIRSFQLAKSAIRTGLDILLDEAHVKYCALDNVYIAGGFGHYLNIDSAINVGLLPLELINKYVNVGNSAGLGTILYALDGTNEKRVFLDEITKNATIIDLNSHKEFLDRFTDNMEI